MKTRRHRAQRSVFVRGAIEQRIIKIDHSLFYIL